MMHDEVRVYEMVHSFSDNTDQIRIVVGDDYLVLPLWHGMPASVLKQKLKNMLKALEDDG